MIRTEKINVANGEYTIHELQVKQMLQFRSIFSNGNNVVDYLISLIKLFSDIPEDKIDELSISDMELIAEKIMDLNKNIVEIPRKLGLGEVSDNILKKMKQQMVASVE